MAEPWPEGGHKTIKERETWALAPFGSLTQGNLDVEHGSRETTGLQGPPVVLVPCKLPQIAVDTGPHTTC